MAKNCGIFFSKICLRVRDAFLRDIDRLQPNCKGLYRPIALPTCSEVLKFRIKLFVEFSKISVLITCMSF